MRRQQRLSLLADFGWNSLVGLGPELAFHAHPHLTLEGGAGLALEGWKVGARARVNLTRGALTPFIGAGLMHAFGVTPVDITDEADYTKVISVIRIKPSTYVQGVVGLDWIDHNSFNLVTCAGYAWLLGGDNVEVLSGTPTAENRTALDVALGSGLVLSLAMGYSFR